ncbi:MAG TPA: hypothetical protein VKD90_03765, partial [Gemmataceae bacterium]|nr:hypothetical protein [Gemmataceae bacterium]
TGKPTGTWPVPPGAPEVVVDRPSTTINWFGGDYLMFGDRLLDRERELTLCEYKPANLWVAWSGSPDGRLWSAGNFKELLGRIENVGGRSQKVPVTPGPIADAGLQGKNLLAACSVPNTDVKNRLQATLSGITFRPDEPMRIEVTGSGSTEAKKLLADAAAEELTKRGKAVDPSAKVGVRIELSRATREQVSRSSEVQYIGNVPPGELRDVYQIQARLFLLNLEKGRKSKAVPGVTLYTSVTEPNWETVL